MSLIQAILIGLMSCTAASTIACLGTTVGNYTLNRPLVASLFVGLILTRMYPGWYAYAGYVDCAGYTWWNRSF